MPTKISDDYRLSLLEWCQVRLQTLQDFLGWSVNQQERDYYQSRIDRINHVIESPHAQKGQSFYGTDI